MILVTGALSAIDETVNELQNLILDQLSPGERLPPESELAESFGVSRLTVREAIKLLEGRGLLDVARGRRAVVQPTRSDVLSDYLAIALRRDPRGLLELTAVRRSLEVLSVRVAARTATGAALLAIDSAHERMIAAASELDREFDVVRLEEYHRSDLDFHAAIALASGNRMLGLILDSLASCLRQSFEMSAHGHMARGGTVDEDVKAHGAIAAAIRAHDAALAERRMEAHLDQAERDLTIAIHAERAAPAGLQATEARPTRAKTKEAS
jgi:GntR family transcriptional repressor for pyruvate dehydrogenase complex